MIRALAICLCLAAPAAAQTPAPVSVANDLRACIVDQNGFREAARLAQLDASMAMVPNRRWSNVTEVAPGVHRIMGSTPDITIEIKLRDASGAAHCMAFGSKLGSGQAALAADKFVELGFLTGLEPAPPEQGMSRRYVVTGPPYKAELIALRSTGHGEVVGFSFAGVPPNLTTRALSRADPNVTAQSVNLALSNAINICLRNYFDRATLQAALPAGGFDLGFADGRNENVQTFFTADNAVSVRLGPGQCQIETLYLSPSAAIQIVGAALNANAPGMFEFRNQSHTGCPGFFAGPGLNLPLSLNIQNTGPRGPATCTEDGTSRITFVVAG